MLDEADQDALAAIERRMEAMHRQVQVLVAAVESSGRLAALGVLAASVAHEVNNILTPIQGFTRAALARPDDAALARRAIERAAAGAERGAAIARSILSLAGDDPAQPAAGCNVGRCADEAVDHLADLLDAGTIRVENGIGPEIGARMSREGLVQVFQNLLLNAAAAMGDGGGIVRLLASTEVDEQVRIDVCDDGPGVPAGIQQRLFRPFAAREAGDRVGGSGLGLSICKTLVETVGGRISLRSAPGQGTTVSIVLPAASLDRQE
ncbi:MAG: HAMP domain-containing sensor histidine kinase, partial [Phycisphaerales bacterium]